MAAHAFYGRRSVGFSYCSSGGAFDPVDHRHWACVRSDRTLYNMVVLYDNPQSQQEAYSALKTLKWLGTIAKTHLHFSEVFKNYQALVAATALNPVATRAGALS